jgi:glycosyltransferase involved in cell wall biosynthesis
LAVWILRLNWKNPRDLLKSFILVPRSLDVLFLLQRAEPDVVHIFWGHYPAIVGYLVRRHLPRSVLSMFLGAYDLRSRYPGTSPVARASQVVWTHAQSNVPTIESLGVPRDRIHVVYRGIDVMASPHGATHRVARRVVTAGRLNRAKAMDRVLVAFSRIRQEWPDASLVVLGDGPERPHLVALAKQLGVMPAVTFRGFVSQDDLRHELATAEVFLFLSRIECLPNVVKEAMVSGCVCVVSKTPGIDELVEDTVTGFLVDQDDVEQAARRVAHVFQHPDQVAGLTAAAHRHVAAKFDVTQSMRNYRDAWAELLAARRQMAPDTQQARRRSNPAPRARSMVQG